MPDSPASSTYTPFVVGQGSDLGALQPKELPPLQARYDRQASGGLDTSGGQINLRYGPKALRGRQALKIFAEMGDDSTVGVLLFLIQNITRNVRWFVRENSTSKEDLENKSFLETCIDDLDLPFDEFISSCLTMCQFGFAPHETVYKKRLGSNPPDRHQAPSNYNDERLGWATFQLIGQDTVERWEFDENNQVLALWQMAAPSYKMVRIDQSRLLNFRTSNLFDNPQGISPLRRAYEAWRAKINLERIEEVAIERDYCGVAVVHISNEILMLANQPITDSNASQVAGAKKLIASLASVARDIKTNEQQGILFPMGVDSSGNDAFKLELLNSTGSRTIDVGKVIERRKNEIWGTILADFLGLGQGSQSQGSYAMHQDKSALFIMAMRTYLRIITETFNRIAIPRLFRLNGISAAGYPEIDHTPLEQVDISQLATSMQALAAAGMPIFPNPDIERRLYEILGLPTPVGDNEAEGGVSLDVGDDEQQEVHEIFQGDKVAPDGTVEVPPEHRPPATNPALNPDQRIAAQAKAPARSYSRLVAGR